MKRKVSVDFISRIFDTQQSIFYTTMRISAACTTHFASLLFRNELYKLNILENLGKVSIFSFMICQCWFYWLELSSLKYFWWICWYYDAHQTPYLIYILVNCAPEPLLFQLKNENAAWRDMGCVIWKSKSYNFPLFPQIKVKFIQHTLKTTMNFKATYICRVSISCSGRTNVCV